MVREEMMIWFEVVARSKGVPEEEFDAALRAAAEANDLPTGTARVVEKRFATSGLLLAARVDFDAKHRDDFLMELRKMAGRLGTTCWGRPLSDPDYLALWEAGAFRE